MTSIKYNIAQKWHKNVPIILIYPDVNMRSAFHKIQALALTNGISRRQNHWSDSEKYTKGTKCTRGKSKHYHAWMHLLLIAVCAKAHRNTHMYSTHTHLRGVRQHQQVFHNSPMLALFSKRFLLFPLSISLSFFLLLSLSHSTKISISLESVYEVKAHAHIQTHRQKCTLRGEHTHAGLLSAWWVEP